MANWRQFAAATITEVLFGAVLAAGAPVAGLLAIGVETPGVGVWPVGAVLAAGACSGPAGATVAAIALVVSKCRRTIACKHALLPGMHSWSGAVFLHKVTGASR